MVCEELLWHQLKEKPNTKIFIHLVSGKNPDLLNIFPKESNNNKNMPKNHFQDYLNQNKIIFIAHGLEKSFSENVSNLF
jgi:hypothetical protein